MVTRARGRAARVVIRVLVERDEGRGVDVAEDVAAAAAVVAAGEVAKGALAGRVVADAGGGVGLLRLAFRVSVSGRGLGGLPPVEMLGTFQCVLFGRAFTSGNSSGSSSSSSSLSSITLPLSPVDRRVRVCRAEPARLRSPVPDRVRLLTGVLSSESDGLGTGTGLEGNSLGRSAAGMKSGRWRGMYGFGDVGELADELLLLSDEMPLYETPGRGPGW